MRAPTLLTEVQNNPSHFFSPSICVSSLFSSLERGWWEAHESRNWCQWSWTYVCVNVTDSTCRCFMIYRFHLQRYLSSPYATLQHTHKAECFESRIWNSTLANAHLVNQLKVCHLFEYLNINHNLSHCCFLRLSQCCCTKLLKVWV